MAVDVAPRMVALGRAKARNRNLVNIDFLVADMTRLDQPPERFDAVVSVLGLFFVQDMAQQVAVLWRLVKPGGMLAITTLGRHFFSPIYDVWKTSVKAELNRNEVVGPWERTNDPAVVSDLLTRGGATNGEVTEENSRLPLPAPEAWWEIVMGTGMRKWVTDLGADAARRVRDQNILWLREHRIWELTLGAIYATARKR